MISLILEWALFFLVLFVFIPGLMIVAMWTRDCLAQYRQQGMWHRHDARKSPG